jgi:hypothetical protein
MHDNKSGWRLALIALATFVGILALLSVATTNGGAPSTLQTVVHRIRRQVIQPGAADKPMPTVVSQPELGQSEVQLCLREYSSGLKPLFVCVGAPLSQSNATIASLGLVFIRSICYTLPLGFDIALADNCGAESHRLCAAQCPCWLGILWDAPGRFCSSPLGMLVVLRRRVQYSIATTVAPLSRDRHALYIHQDKL